jgi:CheY-like chemotaxis protein
MPSVLICAPASLMNELQDTLRARADVERRTTAEAAQAIAMMLVAKPDLLLIDERLAEAETLIAAVRANPVTRPVSIVVMAMDDFDPAELRFITSGANAILRLPAGPDWDARLEELLHVPPRRPARLAALVQFEASGGGESIQTVAGTVLNISEHGMLVETDVPLPIGVDVDFKIHLRDSSGAAPVAGCGQLVRQETQHRSGIRFYGLEADGIERIRQFVGTRR